MEGTLMVCTKCGGTRFHNSTGYKKSWCGDCVNELRSAYQKKGIEAMQQYKKNAGCELCGETRHWMLDFHHRDGERAISIRGREWFHKKTQEELAKCAVLCANCHRDVHFLYNGKVRQHA